MENKPESFVVPLVKFVRDREGLEILLKYMCFRSGNLILLV